MFVLDEADEMLSRGFKEQIYDVFKNVPNNVQVGDSCMEVISEETFLAFLWESKFWTMINLIALSGGTSFGYDAT